MANTKKGSAAPKAAPKATVTALSFGYSFGWNPVAASAPAPAPAKVEFVAPTSLDGWIEALCGFQSDADKARAAAGAAAKRAYGVTKRFAIWMTEQTGSGTWWDTAQGKKALKAYFEAKKAAGHSNPSKALSDLRDTAITYYNACETARAKESGKDPVLVPTSREAEKLKKGPVLVARERIAMLYLELSKDENQPPEVKKALQTLRALATDPVITAIEAPRLEAAAKKAEKAAEKAAEKGSKKTPALPQAPL